MFRGRRLIPAAFVFLPVLAVLGYAMWVRGEVGIFWAYPAILLFHFILERRIANVFNASIVLMAAPFADLWFGPDIALRVTATLLLTIAFANVFSYLTEKQQRKEAEQEQQLALERDRLALLVHATKAGFADWDTVADVVTYSGRFKEILGYPRDADTSAWPSFFDMLHPEDRPAALEKFRAMMRRSRAPGLQEPGEAADYRLRRADGSYIWVQAKSLLQVDAQGGEGGEGRIRRFITSFQDITSFRDQEQRLRTDQRRLDLVVRAARAGIVDWDGRTRETYYSPRFREIRGYPPDADTSGWPDYFKVILHPEDRVRVTARFREYIQGKGPEGPLEYYDPEEYRISRADGSHVWVQSMGVCVRDEKGFVTRFIAAITDITERRAQEEALRESVRLREEVERMSRHDLKTPLNSIIAVPRLLREGRKLGSEERELLSIVERAGYRILNMINLSLDLFRMEQGSYAFRPQAVDLDDMVRKVIADLESQADSKRLSMRVVRLPDPAAGPDAPILARGEDLLCYSLLANLLKNAIEASPEGGEVTVTVEGNAGAAVKIHNPGAVPEAVRESFFEKYSTAGKPGGLGLGAYSAQLMARVQQGSIDMRTSAQEGTTVTVRLAEAPADSAPAAPGTPSAGDRLPARLPQLPALDVLIVEDDEFNRLVMRRYLPSPPLKVAVAVNGRAAIEALRRQPFDFVFLDLEMPVMTGYEAAERIRELERAERRKPSTLVAFSSNDDEASIRRALAAGCDHYLTKPAPRETLWKLLAGGAVAAAKAPAEKEPAFSDPVEIDVDLRPTLAAFFVSRREGLERIEAALGAGERAAAKRLAHTLGGSFSLYGFKWARAQCRRIERAAAEGDLAAAAPELALLRRHLDSAELRFVQTVDAES
jgi:PAS domain S-box-containing protein